MKCISITLPSPTLPLISSLVFSTAGARLTSPTPGEFDGDVSVPLPLGSVLVINGHGADVAKHAVPAVPSPRVSITFRKMDPQFGRLAAQVPFKGGAGRY